MNTKLIQQLNNNIIRITMLASMLAVFAVSQLNASTYNLDAPPNTDFKASFRFWYPDNITTIKAVAVLVPGVNGDGRTMAEDAFWQSFAQRHNFALLACYFLDTGTGTSNYCAANMGSGAALLGALKNFAELSGHPEAENASIILWGHSAGGMFNYEFACWKPKRVIAFIVNKGGYYNTTNPSSMTLNTPAIFFIGEKDSDIRIKNITQFFQGGRSKGALWALAVEPNAGHEIGGTQDMAMSFFESIIPLRLNTDGSLKELREDKGWVGDLTTHAISPALSQPKCYGSWLPDALIAKKWAQFVKHNVDKKP